MRRQPKQERGVILIAFILAIILIGGVIGFVLNSGVNINRRIQTQNAADAAAIGGSTWTARSMNTVAMNNIAISRYLADVNVMDSLTQAVNYTRVEQEAFNNQLINQINSQPIVSTHSGLNAQITQDMQAFQEELQAELDIIIPADDFLQGYNMRSVTHYNGGSGQLWRAMSALDETSQSILEHIPTTAQVSAISSNQNNLPRNENSGTVLFPLEPELPYVRGAFNDFERPVRYGMLPTSIDDAKDNRGPFDAVFGWRDLLSRRVGGTYVPASPGSGGRQVSSGGRGNTPISGGVGGSGGSRGRWVGGTWEVIGYRTYGTHTWLLRNTGNWHSGHVPNSRFASWMNLMANAKLRYLWENAAIVETRRPDWRTSFPEAVSISEAGTPEIHETAFYIYEILSRYPMDSPSFLSDGSWTLVHRNNGQNPRITRRNGWLDPRTWGTPQVGNYSWMDQWEFQVFFDGSIGIEAEYDATGSPVPQTVYRVDLFIFAGVNVGELEEIENPYLGFDRNNGANPAPTHLDRGAIQANNPVSERQYLTYLGVSRRNSDGPMWTSRFRQTGDIYPNHVAVAQTHIYNNHSHDLWTPMWHARLQPVSDFNDWVNVANTGTVPNVADLNPSDVTQLRRYLENVSTLAESSLRH